MPALAGISVLSVFIIGILSVFLLIGGFGKVLPEFGKVLFFAGVGLERTYFWLISVWKGPTFLPAAGLALVLGVYFVSI